MSALEPDAKLVSLGHRRPARSRSRSRPLDEGSGGRVREGSRCAPTRDAPGKHARARCVPPSAAVSNRARRGSLPALVQSLRRSEWSTDELSAGSFVTMLSHHPFYRRCDNIVTLAPNHHLRQYCCSTAAHITRTCAGSGTCARARIPRTPAGARGRCAARGAAGSRAAPALHRAE